MKKLCLYIFMLIALLMGCKGGEGLNSTKTFETTDTNKQINASSDSITKNQFADTEINEIRDLIALMEEETPEIKYNDLDDSLLEFYTKPVKDDYKFFGRFSDKGYAYIIGISKAEKPPLMDLDSMVEKTDMFSWENWLTVRWIVRIVLRKYMIFRGFYPFIKVKRGNIFTWVLNNIQILRIYQMIQNTQV